MQGAGTSCPSKHCSCSHCHLPGRGSQRGDALTCDLLAVRTAADAYCFHHTCLEPGFPHVGGRVAGGDATCVGKLGLCSARGAVWENQERKRQTKQGQTALRSSVGRAARRLFDTRLLGGGGAACSGGLPSGKTDILCPCPRLFLCSPSSDAPRIATLLPGYVETCSVSFPAFPLTFSAFRGWAIPKAIGNLLSGIYLTEATGRVTWLGDFRV